MDLRTQGRAALRALRSQLPRLLLTCVFTAWATDGAESGAWFCRRTLNWRHSWRESPSHYPLLCVCRTIAKATDTVMDCAA
eukprot:5144379-Pyramimonas_sp.AAC.1